MSRMSRRPRRHGQQRLSLPCRRATRQVQHLHSGTQVSQSRRTTVPPSPPSSANSCHHFQIEIRTKAMTGKLPALELRGYNFLGQRTCGIPRSPRVRFHAARPSETRAHVSTNPISPRAKTGAQFTSSPSKAALRARVFGGRCRTCSRVMGPRHACRLGMGRRSGSHQD